MTIVGSGEGTVIQGDFKTLNGLSEGDSVADYLKTSTTNYVTGSGTGVTITADNVTIEGLTISGYDVGVSFGADIEHIRIEDVDINSTVTGIRKGTAVDVTDFDLIGGEIGDSYIGMNISKETANGGDLNDVLIDGTEFTDLVEKGMYFETLSEALITNITMTNVGEWGRGSAPVFHGGATQNIGGLRRRHRHQPEVGPRSDVRHGRRRSRPIRASRSTPSPSPTSDPPTKTAPHRRIRMAARSW